MAPGAEEFLTIVTQVRDESRRDLNRVKGRVDDLERTTERSFRKMSRSGEGFARTLRTNVLRSVTGIATALTGLSALGISLFAGFSAAQGKRSIDAASEFEEQFSKFQVVFGEFAEETAAWAETFADGVGRSRAATAAFLSTFQDTFVPLGFARKEAAELSKELVKLTADVGSFNDAAQEDVIRDFQSAIVGNTETVRKYGIVLTEARTKQVAYSLGIAETGDELTDLQKVQARIAVLFADTGDAQGDLIRTSDSYANVIRRIKDEARDTSIVLGDDLKNDVLDLIEALGGAEGVADLVNIGLLTMNQTAGLLITSFRVFVGEPLSDFVGTGEDANNTAKAIRNTFSELELRVVTAGASLAAFKVIAGDVLSPFTDALGGVKLIVQDIQEEVLDAIDVLSDLGNSVPGIKVNAGRNPTERLLGDSRQAIRDLEKARLDARAREGVSNLLAGADGGSEEAKEALQRIARELGQSLARLREEARETGESFDLDLADRVKKAAAAIRNDAKTIDEAIDDLRGGDANDVAQGSFRVLTGFFDDVTDGAGRSKDAVNDFGRSFLSVLRNLASQRLALSFLNSGPVSGLLGGIGGAFGLRDGGVVSGGLPVQSYAGGGVATSPQLAVFGERNAEAFVPLPGPNRGIPVELNGSGGGVQIMAPITINASTIDGRDLVQRIAGGEVGRAIEDRIAASVRNLSNSNLRRSVARR